MVGRVLALTCLVGCSFQPTEVPLPGLDASHATTPDAPGSGGSAGSNGSNGSGSTGSDGSGGSGGSGSGGVMGMLAVTSMDLPNGDIKLAMEGTTDWAHWGNGAADAFDRKAGGSAISDLVATPPTYFTQAAVTSTWTGGTPTQTATRNDTGAAENQGNTLEFHVAAGTTPATLYVYALAGYANGELDVSLSDNSASPQAVSIAGSNDRYVRFAITFNAASDGQTLDVKWADTHDNSGSTYSFCGLLSATLP